MGLPDFGLSEGGSMLGNFLKNNIFTPTASASNNMGSWTQAPSVPSFNSGSLYASGVAPVKTPTSSLTNTNTVKQTSSGSTTSAQDKTNAAEDKLRKSLSGSFGSTIDAYKNMIGWLPGDQQNLTDQVGTMADTQKNSVHDALNAALAKYQGYRGEVAGNQKATLQDLADNTRNLFQAGNNYLGAKGAGDSSATGMYSAALTQQANKQRGDVQTSVNKQYNDINTSEADTTSASQQQIDSIDTWKASRTSEIVQQYQDLKRQLTVAKAQADDSKKAALSQLDASLFNSAINNLNNIQSTAATYKSQIGSTINDQNTINAGKVAGIGADATAAGASVQPITIDTGNMNIQVTPQGDGTALDSMTGLKYAQKEDGSWYQIQ